MAGHVLKQTSVPEDLIHGLKVHAAQNRKLLQDVYDEAVADFFQQRAKQVKEAKRPDYLASPRGSKELNVRIRNELAQKVDKIAAEDDVTGRRVIYTALVQHARKNKIL